MAIRSPRVFGLSSGFEGRLVFAANTPDATCHRYEKNFGSLNMGSVNSASSPADAMRAPLEQAVIAVAHPDRERGCLISTGMIACHPDHATLARDAAMRRDAMREHIEGDAARQGLRRHEATHALECIGTPTHREEGSVPTGAAIEESDGYIPRVGPYSATP
jgi:hypothetical protein